jgi:hypothetical protein
MDASGHYCSCGDEGGSLFKRVKRASYHIFSAPAAPAPVAMHSRTAMAVTTQQMRERQEAKPGLQRSHVEWIGHMMAIVVH